MKRTTSTDDASFGSLLPSSALWGKVIYMPSVTSSSSTVKVSLIHAATSQNTIEYDGEGASKNPSRFFKDLEAAARIRLMPIRTSEILRKARGADLRTRSPLTANAVLQATHAHSAAEAWTSDVFSVIMAMPYSALSTVIRQDKDGNPIIGSDIVSRLFNPTSMGELKGKLGW